MADVTDLTAFPIGGESLAPLKRNSADLDKLINNTGGTVENRAGDTLRTYAQLEDDFQADAAAAIAEFGSAISTQNFIRHVSKCSFKNGIDTSLNWTSTGADITVTQSATSTITDGVSIGDDDPDSYQLQGFPRSLLTTSSGSIVGGFPSGADAQKHRSFHYTGQTFEVNFRDLSGSSFKIYIDGVFRAEFNATNLNQPRFALIDMGSAPALDYARRIDIVSRLEYWRGITIEPDTTIFPTRDDAYRVAVVGDSITAGTGSDGLPWAKVLGLNLNCPDLYKYGIGGSGYINNGQTGTGRFINRIDEVVDYNPDYVFVAGGINDQASTNQEFSDAVDAYYAELLTHISKDQVIICSPFNPGDSAQKIIDYRDILEAKAASLACKFIDMISPDGTDGLYTGSGDSGSKQGDGNADIYTSDDGIHPNQSGHNAAAQFVATRFLDD